MKTYAHVDADCFYVSCERLRDPMLMGRPVAVLGNQGACVIAQSYEMRTSGVDVGMPIWKAKHMCPEGIFIKRDFRWYGLLSHAMQEVLKEFSDSVEYYSIDESFLDLGEVSDGEKLAKQIQDRMLLATGVPVSVGLAPTRYLAKLGSKCNKPFGTCVINEENREFILAKTPIGKVNGIGRKLVKKVKNEGIETALDYALRSCEELKRLLHKPGEVIWYELNGKSVLSINEERSKRKVISRGGSIWGHHKDKNYIWAFLLRNLERFLCVLWDEGIEILRMHVVLVRSDATSDKSIQMLSDYTNDYAPLLTALKKGFEEAYKYGPTYSRVHIVGEPLREGSCKQLNIFYEKDERSEIMKILKAKINKRFGSFTLRNASTAGAKGVFQDKASDFEITDVVDKLLF